MQSTPERGGCLTIWLVLMIIAFAFSAFNYLVNGAQVAAALPGAVPSWAFTVLGIAAVVGVVSAIGLWMWKKWGFYGYIAVAVVALIINAIIGLLVPGIVGAAIGIGILWFLVKDKWASFA
jgi:hypothetical protein